MHGKDSAYLTYQTRVLNYTTDTIQLRKSSVRTIITNQGEGGSSYTLTTSGMLFNKGETVIEILTCTKYTANSNGDVAVQMKGGLPSVLVPATSLAGSTMCGYS